MFGNVLASQHRAGRLVALLGGGTSGQAMRAGVLRRLAAIAAEAPVDAAAVCQLRGFEALSGIAVPPVMTRPGPAERLRSYAQRLVTTRNVPLLRHLAAIERMSEAVSAAEAALHGNATLADIPPRRLH